MASSGGAAAEMSEAGPERASMSGRRGKRGPGAEGGRMTTADRLRRASAARAEEWELCDTPPWSPDLPQPPRRSLPAATAAKPPLPPQPKTSVPNPPRHPSQVLAEMIAKSRAEKAGQRGMALDGSGDPVAGLVPVLGRLGAERGSLGSGASSQPSASEASTSHNSPDADSPDRPDGPPVLLTAEEEGEGEEVEDETEGEAPPPDDILDTLPTSLDDFESQELGLKLERNLSSPGLLSPTTPRPSLSPLLSVAEAAEDAPLDAEDLEVAMINDSYEEQQKQRQLYQEPALKSVFYSHPNPLTSPPSSSSTYENLLDQSGMDTAAVDSLAATVPLTELSASLVEVSSAASLPALDPPVLEAPDPIASLAEAGSKLAAMTGTGTHSSRLPSLNASPPPPLSPKPSALPSLSAASGPVSWAGWGGGRESQAPLPLGSPQPPDDPCSSAHEPSPPDWAYREASTAPRSPPQPLQSPSSSHHCAFVPSVEPASVASSSRLSEDCLDYMEALSAGIIHSVLSEERTWSGDALPSGRSSVDELPSPVSQHETSESPHSCEASPPPSRPSTPEPSTSFAAWPSTSGEREASEADASVSDGSSESAEAGPGSPGVASPVLEDVEDEGVRSRASTAEVEEELGRLVDEVLLAALDFPLPSSLGTTLLTPPPLPSTSKASGMSSAPSDGDAGEVNNNSGPSSEGWREAAEDEPEEEEEEEGEEEGGGWESLCDDSVLDGHLKSLSAALDKVKVEERRQRRATERAVESAAVAGPSTAADQSTAYPTMLQLDGPASTRTEAIHQALLALRSGDFVLLGAGEGVWVAAWETGARAEAALEGLGRVGSGLGLRVGRLSSPSAVAVGAAEAERRAVRRREERSSVVARRLVEGHLGLRSALPAADRQAQRDKLAQARAAKKTAAAKTKAADDAWEGQ